MSKATLRLYKISGLLTATAAIIVAILGEVGLYITLELAIPIMLALLGISALCCANSQEETGSKIFSKICIVCGILLIICSAAITIINFFLPVA